MGKELKNIAAHSTFWLILMVLKEWRGEKERTVWEMTSQDVLILHMSWAMCIINKTSSSLSQSWLSGLINNYLHIWSDPRLKTGKSDMSCPNLVLHTNLFQLKCPLILVSTEPLILSDIATYNLIWPAGSNLFGLSLLSKAVGWS